MRVLHVVGSLSPEWGGLSRAVAGLSGAMASLGVEVEIITTARGDEDQLHPAGTRVQAFRRGPLDWWGYGWNLAREIQGAVRRADLVHIHGLWLYPHLVASRAALRSGTPYIVSPHGMLDPWALRHKRWRKSLYAGLIELRTLRQATAIHAVSDREANDARRLGVSTPVVLVPNGIDGREFANLPDRTVFRRRYPTLAGRMVVLFLSRVHPKKGLDLLVRAFGQVARRGDAAMLVIAGPGEARYRQRLESSLDAEGASARYVFSGMLSGEERLAALASADMFVLPSYSEAFSVAVIEAMAAGLPVIVSDACNVPGIEEAGAGLVVVPEAEPLCGAMLRLIDDPVLRDQMGRRGRQLILANYTWDRVAPQMIRAYETVLAGSKLRPSAGWARVGDRGQERR